MGEGACTGPAWGVRLQGRASCGSYSCQLYLEGSDVHLYDMRDGPLGRAIGYPSGGAPGPAGVLRSRLLGPRRAHRILNGKEPFACGPGHGCIAWAHGRRAHIYGAV
eukprot:2098616-Prymnesium_polylepis.2